MRTQTELVARVRGSPQLSHVPEILVLYLSFELAKEFVEVGVKEEHWVPLPLEKEQVTREMRQYMVHFGWPRATGHRSSARRTVDRMSTWAWLLGIDELVEFAARPENYPMYGAPILFKICEVMGFPIPHDQVAHNMSLGLPCGDPDCKRCRRPDEDEGLMRVRGVA